MREREGLPRELSRDELEIKLKNLGEEHEAAEKYHKAHIDDSEAKERVDRLDLEIQEARQQLAQLEEES